MNIILTRRARTCIANLLKLFMTEKLLIIPWYLPDHCFVLCSTPRDQRSQGSSRPHTQWKETNKAVVFDPLKTNCNPVISPK